MKQLLLPWLFHSLCPFMINCDGAKSVVPEEYNWISELLWARKGQQNPFDKLYGFPPGSSLPSLLPDFYKCRRQELWNFLRDFHSNLKFTHIRIQLSSISTTMKAMIRLLVIRLMELLPKGSPLSAINCVILNREMKNSQVGLEEIGGKKKSYYNWVVFNSSPSWLLRGWGTSGCHIRYTIFPARSLEPFVLW